MPLEKESDESLMALIKKGDHQAFSILVYRHTDRFFGAAYKVVQNSPDAEDIVQNAFLKLWEKPNLWKEGKGAKFTTWFYRIVVNQSLDSIAKKKTNILLDEELESVEKTIDIRMSEQEQQNELEKAISLLPEKQKIALMLYYEEELKQSEAAAAMGLKLKAFESLLSRAKATLKQRLSLKEAA